MTTLLAGLSAVGSMTDSRVRGPRFVTQPVSPSADSRKAVVSYW